MATIAQTDYGFVNDEDFMLKALNDKYNSLVRMSADFNFQASYMLEKGIVYEFLTPYKLVELKKTYRFKTPEKTYLIKKNDTKRLSQITLKYLTPYNLKTQKQMVESYKMVYNM